MKAKIDYELCDRFGQAFAILGRKWNGLILDVLLAQRSGVRFCELASCMNCCSDRVLTERLRELEAAGIVQKIKAPDNKRYLYSLTAKGADLEATIKEVHKWAEKWVTLEEDK